MKRLEFPEIKELDTMFGSIPQPFFNDTLRLAQEEGFSFYGHNEWVKRFDELFFKGGYLKLNKDLDKEYLSKGSALFRAIAKSFEPKHENKTLVCAMILRSIEG